VVFLLQNEENRKFRGGFAAFNGTKFSWHFLCFGQNFNGGDILMLGVADCTVFVHGFQGVILTRIRYYILGEGRLITKDNVHN